MNQLSKDILIFMESSEWLFRTPEEIAKNIMPMASTKKVAHECEALFNCGRLFRRGTNTSNVYRLNSNRYTGSPTRTRKPIQILTAGDELLALCDDSTLWSFDRELQQWARVPGVPA